MPRLLFVVFLVMLMPVPDVWGQVSEVKLDLREDITLDGVGKWQYAGDTLVLIENAAIREPYSRPGAIALTEEIYAGFVLTLDLKLDADPSEEKGDLILVFGYQSPERFYYVHMTGMVDEIHNGVFRVWDGDRQRTGSVVRQPILVDRDWHRVAFAYDATRQLASLVLDQSVNASMVQRKLEVPPGRVGFGSFNDPGRFTNVTIRRLSD